MSHILIIDDEDGVVRYYKKLLESEGYEVTVAPDATQGMRALILADQIDLVLLDINMPDVDGIYMSSVIQEFDPTLKMLIFSVRPPEEQKHFIPYGADFFDKSQSVEILLEKVADLLRQPQTSAVMTD